MRYVLNGPSLQEMGDILRVTDGGVLIFSFDVIL